MGLGFPRVIVSEQDLSYFVDTMIKGISCVSGITEKGPVGEATYISSWPQFQRVFGNEIVDSDFPTLCKRALKRGATLWISRVAHYTSVADSSTMTALASTITIGNFAVSASSPGKWGNALKINVVAGEETGEFDVTLLSGGTKIITWKGVTVADSKKDSFLGKAVSDERITVKYTPGSQNFIAGDYSLVGGNDGLTGLADADYIGDQAAGTGFYAFDEVDNALQLSAPEITSGRVVAAGHGYCENRKDLIYISAIPQECTPQESLNYRYGKGTFAHAPFSSSYGALYFGWPKVYDLVRDADRYINPTGDILGVFAHSDSLSGEHYAAAGIRRGRIPDALGVHYNVGTQARQGEGGILTEGQVNPICVFPDAGMVVWGNETTQSQASALRDIHIRRMLIVLEKGISKIARVDLFEPNDPQLWRQSYNRVKPFMDEMRSKRAFYDFRVECDQNARSLEEAKINTPERVDRGEFRMQVWVKPTRVAKWILLDVVVTKSGASFEEAFADYNGI